MAHLLSRQIMCDLMHRRHRLHLASTSIHHAAAEPVWFLGPAVQGANASRAGLWVDEWVEGMRRSWQEKKAVQDAALREQRAQRQSHQEPAAGMEQRMPSEN